MAEYGLTVLPLMSIASFSYGVIFGLKKTKTSDEMRTHKMSITTMYTHSSTPYFLFSKCKNVILYS